jgi:hypothetical protein
MPQQELLDDVSNGRQSLSLVLGVCLPTPSPQTGNPKLSTPQRCLVQVMDTRRAMLVFFPPVLC